MLRRGYDMPITELTDHLLSNSSMWNVVLYVQVNLVDSVVIQSGVQPGVVVRTQNPYEQVRSAHCLWTATRHLPISPRDGTDVT